MCYYVTQVPCHKYALHFGTGLLIYPCFKRDKVKEQWHRGHDNCIKPSTMIKRIAPWDKSWMCYYVTQVPCHKYALHFGTGLLIYPCFKRDKVKEQWHRGHDNCIKPSTMIKRIAQHEKFPIQHDSMCVYILQRNSFITNGCATFLKRPGNPGTKIPQSSGDTISCSLHMRAFMVLKGGRGLPQRSLLRH